MATFVAGPNIPRPRDFIFGDSPLDVYRDTIQAGLALRKAREPSVAEQKAKQQAIDWVKFRVSKFTEMITNPDIDSASRDHIKMMALEFHGSLPPMFKKAVEPILAYSPLDPVAQGMERFERLNPRPVKPYAMKQVGSAPTGYPGPSGSDPGAGTWTEVRDQGNRLAFAEYDWAMVEWQTKRKIMKNKLLGLGETAPKPKVPKLMPTDDPNMFSYKDDVTQGIGLIDLGKVPKGEVQQAIDDYKDNWPNIISKGAYRINIPTKMQIGDTWEQVGLVRSLFDGAVKVESFPMGSTARSASGEGTGRSKMTEAFKNGLAHANLKTDLDDITNAQSREIAEGIREIEGEDWETTTVKDAKGNVTGLVGGARDMLIERNINWARLHGHIVVPYSGEIKKNIWRYAGFRAAYIEGGKWTAVPVDKGQGLVTYTGTDGKPIRLFYNSELGMAVDMMGRPQEKTAGMPNGGAVDDKASTEPPPKTVEEEAKKRNLTVRDTLQVFKNSILSAMEEGKAAKLTTKAGIGGVSKLEQMLEAERIKYGDNQLMSPALLKSLKVAGDAIGVGTEVWWEMYKRLFYYLPRKSFQLLMNLPVPGTTGKEE